MFQEAAEAPSVVANQLVVNAQRIERLSAALRQLAPTAVVTCARGSSDNAATFARYLIETRLRLLTSSAAPSVSSVYQAVPNLSGAVFLAISQSGSSPDLLAAVRHARAAGALVVALVNVESSPLAAAADYTVPLAAGVETSVAATKSFIASLTAIVHLVATWARDGKLLEALSEAPGSLARAWQLDWTKGREHLLRASNLYVVARGLGLGLAQEAALKLKETCGIHAEAMSSAEMRHGPMAIVRKGFPLLVFSQNDETRGGIRALATELAERNAQVLVAGPSCPGAIALPTESADPVVELLAMAQSFYRMVNSLALARGLDPDRPPLLSKVTATV